MVEKILHQIERLLATNDHAVVPGLGGFFVQQQPARIAGNTIFPSMATISFNPLINQTDGLLAVTLSRELNISYKEASKLIEKETAQLLYQLKKHKKASFGHLGSFRMDKDAHLLFNPTEHADFLPANFGLKAIKLPNNKVVKSKDVVFTISAKRLMQSVAVFITLIALLFSSEVNDTAHVVQANLYSLNVVDLPEITVTPTITSDEESVVLPETAHANQVTYKVVVAVFQTEAYASAYCNELIAQRFDESEVINSTSNAKVSIRTFPDLLSAVNFMEELRHQDNKFKDAWVLKTKS